MKLVIGFVVRLSLAFIEVERDKLVQMDYGLMVIGDLWSKLKLQQHIL